MIRPVASAALTPRIETSREWFPVNGLLDKPRLPARLVALILFAVASLLGLLIAAAANDREPAYPSQPVRAINASPDGVDADDLAEAPLTRGLAPSMVEAKNVTVSASGSDAPGAIDGRLLIGVSIAFAAMAGAWGAASLFGREMPVRKATEDKVLTDEALLRGVFDYAPGCILVVSKAADGGFVLDTCNRAAEAAFGRAARDVNGRPLFEVLPAMAALDLERCFAGGEVLELADAVMFGKNGRTWDVALAPILGDGGRAASIIVTARDTTERKLGSDLLREGSERYRLIAYNVADLVVRLGSDLSCGFVSPAIRDLGYEPEELIALPLTDIVHPDDRAAFQHDIRRLETSGQIAEFRFRARNSQGAYIWVEATGRPVVESGGTVLAVRDISRRKQIEDELETANRQLEVLAARDGLTGLANRRSFDEAFGREWRRAAREMSPLGLIMLDVDRFKAYNDIYGRQTGDECLCAVASAIRESLLRPGDFAARYDGEKFVVILPNTDQPGTTVVAERIRQAVAAAGLEHRGNARGVVTISAGIWSSYPMSLANPREALKGADANLYAAKAAGRNRVMYGALPLVVAG
jgi:diguanylate cyclase (GGDEF)-like protein/PAS domain S-box-containing protein